MSSELTLALDAMGGDHAPECVLRGAEMALVRFPGIRFILFGDESKIKPLLNAMPKLAEHCTIVHTDQFVSMEEKPSVALRQGKQSSMRLAIDAVKEGEAVGVVSAGNTGALMAMSTIVLRTLTGIKRPAIAALFPTMHGECVMLDLGANVQCDAQDLFLFSIMGDAFARAVLGLSHPRIGLLNVGSEDEKGHEEVKEAAALIRNAKEQEMNFSGFVEGTDIPKGEVDVIVTDGFTGNVALKTAEGTARLIRTYLKDAFKSSLLAKCGALLACGALKTMKEKLDDRKRNGAMFLGLNGIVVKSHGSADAFSFCNAISVAVELASHKINQKIVQEIKLSSAVEEKADA